MPTDEELAAQKATDDAAAAKAKADEDEAKALGLGDAGKKALDAERLRAKQAELAATEANRELSKLRKLQTDADAAKAKADADDLKAKGEFEKLADERGTKLADTQANLDATSKTLERANTVLVSVIADRVKVLEATKDKDLIAAFPKDAEPLTQLEWLDDPRTKVAMSVASEAVRVADAQSQSKLPRTPNPNGNTQQDATEREKQRLIERGKYAI